ncbi:Ig-like domain-containing protein [Persicimonas caeni]|uniref:Ig-like domain-containing protein n=1 Tax=Persicimonas caeni TaxID=2292766 RepID=UPI00143D662A|nr:Ig-like domain-containing protein [Persicimonas caeni]
MCVDQVCKREGFDAGDIGNDSGDQDTGVPEDTFDDASDDEGPPSVESVTPAAGATDVATDTTIEIVFSEPMDPFTINFYSIVLRDTNNREVDITVTYDADAQTATVTPQINLQPAASYRLRVESLARDMAGNGLDPDFEATFYTAYDEPAEHTTLAETFAPVIYQGIADSQDSGPNGDIPTLLDFDDNLSAADNGANSRRSGTTTEAHVYYHVTESAQYYFLHYILYYPSRLDVDDQSRAEHDFAGAVFVVDKSDNSLLLVEGVSLLDSGEVTSAYKPDGSPVSLPGGNIGNMTLASFGADKLEDGTHYPMYVPGGVHETCNWHKSGSNSRCLHNPGQFRGTDGGGVVMRHGDTAQSYDEATENQDSGHLEMTYKLVPLASTVWAYRGSYGSGGLFEIPFIYEPTGTDRPIGFNPQDAHVLPRRLQSGATENFGRTPFFWLPSPGEDNHGQWLMDPVYILPNRYNFGESVTTEYCYNFFFDIDNRSSSIEGCGGN